MGEYLSTFTCIQVLQMHRIDFTMEYMRNFNEYMPKTHHNDVTEYVASMIHRQWRFGWIGHRN